MLTLARDPPAPLPQIRPPPRLLVLHPGRRRDADGRALAAQPPHAVPVPVQLRRAVCLHVDPQPAGRHDGEDGAEECLSESVFGSVVLSDMHRRSCCKHCNPSLLCHIRGTNSPGVLYAGSILPGVLDTRGQPPVMYSIQGLKPAVCSTGKGFGRHDRHS